MGRSVSRPHNAVAVAFRTLTVEPWQDEDSGEMFEPTADDYAFEFEYLVDWIRERSKELWPSMVTADKWLDREDHALLQNDLAYVGISEYCGMVSIWLVPRTEDYNRGYDDDRNSNLCENWCGQIANKFLREFSEYNSIARASNGEELFERVVK